MHTRIAELTRYGVLAASGGDVRAFLHGQLTNDVEHQPPGQARLAGWCSPKGRLLASFLLLPCGEGFLLLVSRDIAAATARRLAMFILRAKVQIKEDSAAWSCYGVWGETAAATLQERGLPVPSGSFATAGGPDCMAVAVDEGRYLVMSRAPLARLIADAADEDWALQEIRAGRVLITAPVQDQFVPQMVSLERTGAVDFRKGCYPGQEIVARTQYRGLLKRRLYRLCGAGLQPGQDLYCDDQPGQAIGTVVNAAGGEALAVLQIAAVETAMPIRAAADSPPLQLLPLPYAP